MSGGAIHGNLDCFGVNAKVEQLKSQLSQVQGELERFETGNSYLLGIQDGERHVNFNLHAERDSLQKEVQKITKDRDSWADMYEDLLKRTKDLAKEVQRYTKALIRLRDYEPHPSHCDHIHEIVTEALLSNEKA